MADPRLGTTDVVDIVSRALLRVLRVPPEPRLPAGEPGSARVFRAGKNYFRLRLLRWGAKQAATVVGFVFFMGMLQAAPDSMSMKNKGRRQVVVLKGAIAFVQKLEILAIGLWVLQLPVTFAAMRLDYRLRWYIVTDRSARLREGVASLTEMTFTLANVQDIRIRQGPLQRALGLADVELRTAGGSEPAPGSGHGSTSGGLHVARFRGVENAEAIRDLVVDRMKRARGAGLGDPEDHAGAASAASSAAAPAALAAAAHAMAREATLLRGAAAHLLGNG